MHPILEGILLGSFLMLFVGPSFFYMIGVGMRKGFVEAGSFAVGIFTSDTLLVFAIFMGLSPLFETVLFQEVFSILAGVMILGLGIRYLTKHQRHASNARFEDIPLIGYVAKGFAINIMNPFTFLIWIGVTGALGLEKDYSQPQYVQFFSALFCTIFSFDLLKAFLANRLGTLLSEKFIRKVDKILGVVFIMLSIRLFYFFIELVWLNG